MGKGNVCVTGKYEGLYYIYGDDYTVYSRDDTDDGYADTRLGRELDYAEFSEGSWLYDEVGTMEELADIEDCFKRDFCELYPSFEDNGLPDKWIRNGVNITRRVLLENSLFYICAEDNEQSEAIELIQKAGPYGDELVGLQAIHAPQYLNGIKHCLLKRLPSIGGYKGAWTMDEITQE